MLEAVQASNAYRASSLDSSRSADEDSGTIGDGLGVVEEGYRLAEHRVVLENLMHSLTLRERNVITLRFEHDLTQAEIGARLGVSQMQVSRILRQSLARLRTIAETRS